MTDHKFEPFQQVLVRNADDEKWKADFYSHHRTENWPHECAGDVYKQCILYTPETAHLLGTSQPYEPPKPPQEYERGQKVEVLSFSGSWEDALYIGRAKNNDILAILDDDEIIRQFSEDKVRPLTDTAAQRGGFFISGGKSEISGLPKSKIASCACFWIHRGGVRHPHDA